MADRRWVCGAVLLSVAGLAGCDQGATEPAAGGQVAIAVAPLNLTGVTDATYTLTVLNGQDQMVWTKQVTSSSYGDSAGSVSYVGTCDADPAPATNTVQIVLDALTGPTGDLTAGLDYFNPAPSGSPLEKTVVCQANTDVAVTFDVSFARAAQQGFFDVAVQFEDLFCSAKLDCQGDQGQPLKLLFDATGSRADTAVMAFACTGGQDADSWLYLSDLSLDCGGGDVTTVDPSLGPGTLSLVPAANLPNTHLFDALITRGSEQLGTYTKRYWNVALGLTAVAGCTLSARGTASDGGFGGTSTPTNAVWPYVQWTAPMSSCTKHALNAADGVVSTQYTGFAGETFAHPYHGDQVPILGAATLADPGHWQDGTIPASCDGYRHPAAPRVYGGQGDGYYTIDPLQDGGTVTVYCDMTSDGGGWTRVFAYVNAQGQYNALNPQTTLNAGLAAAATGTGYTDSTAIRPYYLAGGYASMRFECAKVAVGRKVDIVTDVTTVLDFLAGGSGAQPAAPGTITTLPDDTSILSGNATGVASGGPSSGSTFSGPAAWGDDGTNYYAGLWGHSTAVAAARFTNAPLYIGYTAHWYFANPRAGCDDYDPTGANGYEGYWYIWVR